MFGIDILDFKLAQLVLILQGDASIGKDLLKYVLRSLFILNIAPTTLSQCFSNVTIC
jgi:hypothetical protein